MEAAQAAVAYCERGWSVVPLLNKRQPLLPWSRLKSERLTPKEIHSWWADHPEAMVGVALGKVSGVVRVDADGPEAEAELAKLGGMPETAEFTTPSGGRGWLLVYLDGAKTEQIWKGAGPHQELRVQSCGAYTVLPPSKGYIWVRECKPAAMPRWLYDRVVANVLKSLEAELRPTFRQPERSEVLEALSHIPADDYDTWVQVGMALRATCEDYFATWEAWSKSSSKYVEGECGKKWATFCTDGCGLTARSLFYWAERSDGWKPPNRHEPVTELGNARVLARVAAGKAVHSSKWGWLVQDGKRWRREDAEKEVVEMQKGVLEERLKKAIVSLTNHLRSDSSAADYEAEKKVKVATIATIRKHEDENHVRGARLLAQSEPELTVDYRLFDQDPFLFNCANGTLDLRTGEFRDHRPEDYITQLCTLEYDEGAQCPRWLKFLEEVLPDKGVRDFLRLFLGACLTGDTSPQIMPVFWGGGSNGKSTLVNAVLNVLGEDYSMKAKQDFLVVTRGTEHPTSKARLFGKRFVACVETGEDARLNEALVKELTGSDPIAARRMREDEWEFLPTHKPILVTNHRPEVKGTDDAIWRRLPLVPFTRAFAKGDCDPELPDKLLSERSGVLTWMVEGCRDWLANGRKLELQGAVKAATAEYRSEQDGVGAFIAECCTVGEGLKVRIAEKLLPAYTAWCSRNSYRPLNGRAFSAAMDAKGFPCDATRKFRTGLTVVE